MEVKGYNVSTLTVNHTGVESGNIQLGGKSISFSEIEPLALAGTAADLVINLPAGPNTDVVIADDTNANFPDLVCRLPIHPPSTLVHSNTPHSPIRPTACKSISEAMGIQRPCE